MKQAIKQIGRSWVNRVLYHKQNSLAAKLQHGYQLPLGKKRVYHYHIRKTAGTSLNLAFFSEHGEDESKFVHSELTRQRLNSRAINRDEVFVGWDRNLLSKGHYLYGFSHSPMHQLKIPKDTFTVSIFRDPVKRVLSHYNMLRHYLSDGRFQAQIKPERDWASPDFATFLQNIPRQHLQNQLYMFSKNFDLDEAYENIIGLDYVMFTETFEEDLERLSKRIDRRLLPHREKNYGKKHIPDESQILRLREMMQPEIALVDSIRSSRNFDSACQV